MRSFRTLLDFQIPLCFFFKNWSIFFFRFIFSCTQTEYREILCMQSECGKIRTGKTPNMDTFYAVLFVVAEQPKKLLARKIIFRKYVTPI